MLDKIRELLKRAWDSLKKIFTKVVSFLQNIVNFFKSKYDAIIRKKPNAKAISIKIKEVLETGDYNTVNMSDFDTNLSKDKIVNTFYDMDTGEILEEETEVISYESLDEQTKAQFSDKDMIVLENN